MQTAATKRPRGQPRVFRTADDLQTAIDSYWTWLKSNSRTVTLNRRGDTAETSYPAYWPRLLLHIGLDDSTATPYINGDYDDEDNNYSGALARARMTVEALIAEGSLRGEVNDRVAQLILGAHHGVIQRTEQVVSGTVMHRLEMPPAERIAEAAQRLSAGLPDAITAEYEPVE